MVWFRWGCTASCGWHVRCFGVRGDAWSVLLSPCNTLAWCFVGDWLFVFPLCGFSLSLFCNYTLAWCLPILCMDSRVHTSCNIGSSITHSRGTVFSGGTSQHSPAAPSPTAAAFPSAQMHPWECGHSQLRCPQGGSRTSPPATHCRCGG